MKLHDARENYYVNTGKASDLVRQLGFAAIAIIWLFKIDEGGVTRIPPSLLVPLLLVVVALAADFLQYALASAIWGLYQRHQEKRILSEETEFRAPASINWPAIVFFWGKIVCIVVAYCYLFKFLARTILAFGA